MWERPDGLPPEFYDGHLPARATAHRVPGSLARPGHCLRSALLGRDLGFLVPRPAQLGVGSAPGPSGATGARRSPALSVLHGGFARQGRVERLQRYTGVSPRGGPVSPGPTAHTVLGAVTPLPLSKCASRGRDRGLGGGRPGGCSLSGVGGGGQTTVRAPSPSQGQARDGCEPPSPPARCVAARLRGWLVAEGDVSSQAPAQPPLPPGPAFPQPRSPHTDPPTPPLPAPPLPHSCAARCAGRCPSLSSWA